jgi:hypothetical protein
MPQAKKMRRTLVASAAFFFDEAGSYACGEFRSMTMAGKPIAVIFTQL